MNRQVTKRVYLLGIFLLMVMVLVQAPIIIGAEEPIITFSRTSLRPGDFLLVTVETSPNSQVAIRLLDQAKPLYTMKDSGRYIGLIGVPYRTQPGSYVLNVGVENPQSSFTKAQLIEVTPYRFTEQRITVPEKMRENTITPEKQTSDAKVTSGVREESAKQQLAPLWEGSFIQSVTGRITTEFGMIRYVNDIENGRHSGLDIAAPIGTPVLAVNHGVVVFADQLYATGNTVIISHGLDLYSSYAHLSKITVAKGMNVAKGQEVGKIGMTGLTTGPHLHLTFRVGEVPVNPDQILGKEIALEPNVPQQPIVTNNK